MILRPQWLWLNSATKCPWREEIEVFGPGRDFFSQKLEVLLDEEDLPIESAPHPQQTVKIKMAQPVGENFILRKKKIKDIRFTNTVCWNKITINIYMYERRKKCHLTAAPCGHN